MGIKRKADHIAIYGVYDTRNDYGCIFVGTRKEVADYFGRTPHSISQAISEENLIKARYDVKFIYYEKLTELECRVCHEIKPIRYLKKRGKGKGHAKICKACFNAKYGSKKYGKKKGGD
jgi:hypothetical protein